MAGYDWGAFYGALGIPAAQAAAPMPPPSLGNPKTTPLSQYQVDMGHDANYWTNFYQSLALNGRHTGDGGQTYGFPDPSQVGTNQPPARLATPDPNVYQWGELNPMDAAAAQPTNSPGLHHIVRRWFQNLVNNGAGANAPPVRQPVAVDRRLVLTAAQRAQSTPEYRRAVDNGSLAYTPAGSNTWMPTTTISGAFRQNYGDSNSGSGSLSSAGGG